MQLDRNVEVGTVVTTLVVSDADIGINAQIVYEGIRGDFAPLFLGVNEQSGQISTIR